MTGPKPGIFVRIEVLSWGIRDQFNLVFFAIG